MEKTFFQSRSLFFAYEFDNIFGKYKIGVKK